MSTAPSWQAASWHAAAIVKSDELTLAYLEKASVRPEALGFYRKRKAYSDAVREAQSVAKLALKALLRAAGIEVPKVHDVGRTLEDNAHLLPPTTLDHMARILCTEAGC